MKRVDKSKKNQGQVRYLWRKKVMIPAVVAVAVSTVGVSAFHATHESAKETDTTEVMKSATAQVSDLATTISSTGTLESDDSIAVDIPSGLKIKKVLVSSGDTVKKGTKLATVYKSSAASLLLNVRDSIDTLEDEIDDLEDEDDINDTDSDSYLQKLVYDQELSDLEKEEDDLEEIVENGYIVSDKAGTINAVNLSAGSTTAANASTDTSSDGGNSQSDTTTSSGASSTASKTSSVTASSLSSSSANTAKIVRLSTASGDSEAGSVDTTMADSTETSENSSESNTQSNESTSEKSTESSSSSDDTREDSSQSQSSASDTANNKNSQTSSGNSQVTTISSDSISSITITRPRVGGSLPQTIEGSNAYAGTIRWSTTKLQAGKTVTATMTLTAKDGYAFTTSEDYKGITISGGKVKSASVQGGDQTQGNQLILKVTYTVAGEDSSKQSNSSSGNKDNTSAGMSSGGRSGSSGGVVTNATASGASSGSGSTSDSSSTETSANVDLADDYVDAVTLISGDDMVVDVSIDEEDINSVKVGQTATVTLDAISGQSFEGEITSVSNAASNSESGSVKYTAEVTIDKTSEMLDGMTATAVINVEEAEDAIVIPSAAIQESQGSVYVYTTKEKDGTLSGKTEVTTGLSNGSSVQITDGLKEGDKVYYTITTNSNSSDQNSKQNRGQDFGQGGPGGNGGGRPSGDPSGGNGGK